MFSLCIKINVQFEAIMPCFFEPQLCFLFLTIFRDFITFYITSFTFVQKMYHRQLLIGLLSVLKSTVNLLNIFFLDDFHTVLSIQI